MKKQTAVEWFFDNLKNHEIQAEHFQLYEQAKAMEKEQIKDAYSEGDSHGWSLYSRRTSEQYYNETYTDTP
jgi:hypothetical protein